MTVVLEASNGGEADVGSGDVAFSITVPGGLSNSLLLVGVSSGSTITSFLIDSGGASLTQLNSRVDGSFGENAAWFYILNPAAGSHTPNAPGISDKAAYAAVFSGVDQTTPFGTEVHSTGLADPDSLAVTVIAGGLAVSLLGFNVGDSPPTATGGQSTMTGTPTAAGTASGRVLGETKSGSGTVTLNWTGGTADVARLVPLNPAGGGGGPVSSYVFRQSRIASRRRKR